MSRPVRLVAGVLIALLVAGSILVVLVLRPVNPRGQPQIITIPQGASPTEISGLLAAAGLIRRPVDFVLVVRARGWARSLHEGDYQLSSAMTLLEIADTLVRGQVIEYSVTIPEGFTAAEIAATLEREALVDRTRFLELVRHGAGDLPYDFLRTSPTPTLEGYLFPDTYRIPRHLPARKSILVFLDRFAQVVLPRWSARPDKSVTLHEIVTIASLVEREAKVATEQPLIAGVIYNRLRRGWRLEVDATVLYALGYHKAVVTYEDLKIDSPYNTYRYSGLPPGPIANPGLGAIEAALAPAQTEYLFYVARRDGTHEFSKTLAEHLAAVRRYRTGP